MTSVTIDINPDATSSIENTLTPRLDAAMMSEIPENVSRQIPPLLSQAQAYYWSHAWQLGEQESLADLQAGRFKTFTNADDVVRYLLSADDD